MENYQLFLYFSVFLVKLIISCYYLNFSFLFYLLLVRIFTLRFFHGKRYYIKQPCWSFYPSVCILQTRRCAGVFPIFFDIFYIFYYFIVIFWSLYKFYWNSGLYEFCVFVCLKSPLHDFTPGCLCNYIEAKSMEYAKSQCLWTLIRISGAPPAFRAQYIFTLMCISEIVLLRWWISEISIHVHCGAMD